MSEEKESCVKTAKGPVTEPQGGEAPANNPQPAAPAIRVAQVGKPAPDFEANAFQDGGFHNIKLSDFKGQWLVLCFYPGDFTFV